MSNMLLQSNDEIHTSLSSVTSHETSPLDTTSVGMARRQLLCNSDTQFIASSSSRVPAAVTSSSVVTSSFKMAAVWWRRVLCVGSLSQLVNFCSHWYRVQWLFWTATTSGGTISPYSPQATSITSQHNTTHHQRHWPNNTLKSSITNLMRSRNLHNKSTQKCHASVIHKFWQPRYDGTLK